MLFNGRKTISFLFIVLTSLMACNEKPQEELSEDTSLKAIREKGKISAVTDFNSTNYFIYRGKPMGFQYELLQRLAKELNVDLEIVVNNDLEKNFQMLEAEKVDIIAVNLTVTHERSKRIDFTLPHNQTRQVLVQRKPENWRRMSTREVELSVIRNQLELAGKRIHVQSNSSFAERLKNLSEEIGDSINIIETSEYEVEQLIGMVAKGEIDYTVADENVALINQTYYSSLDVQTAISFPQNLAWGLRKEDDSLRLAINNWLKSFKNSASYNQLYNKYFYNIRAINLVESEHYTINSGQISEYDDLIKNYNDIVGWDWRLIASLIYQESRFKPAVRSWAGAFGLMQLMPSTARRFGASRKSSPEKNIEAGIKFLKWLDTRFLNRGIDDDEERIKFILGAYNVGLGHILDARRLTEKYGKDPDLWDDNVEDFILKKSNPKYYNDEVVYYGYARGYETYNYVLQILERYEQYKNIIPGEEDQ